MTPQNSLSKAWYGGGGGGTQIIKQVHWRKNVVGRNRVRMDVLVLLRLLE